MMDPVKTCKLCAETKSLEDFYRYSTTGKPYAACKPCHLARTTKRAKENPDRHRAATWRNK